jgi:hypothetical protein
MPDGAIRYRVEVTGQGAREVYFTREGA